MKLNVAVILKNLFGFLKRLGHPVAGRRPVNNPVPTEALGRILTALGTIFFFFGGFVSQDQDEHGLDNHERSIPTAAHAEYFRLRRKTSLYQLSMGPDQ
jgi:hypothetical protein